VTFPRRDRLTIQEDDPIAAHGGHANVARDDAYQIERVHRSDHIPLLRLRAFAMLPQSLDGVGQRKLLASHAAHESPAADLATHLKPPQYRQ
jgi:hypothetical protein